MDTMPPCAVIFPGDAQQLWVPPFEWCFNWTGVCLFTVSVTLKMTGNMKSALLVLLLICALNFSAAFPMEPLQKVYNLLFVLLKLVLKRLSDYMFFFYLTDTSADPTIRSTAVRKCNTRKLTGEKCVYDWTQSDLFVCIWKITAVLMFVGREGQQSWIPSEKSQLC